MESHLVTKEDLRQFRIDLLTDLKPLIVTNGSEKPDQKWLKSGPIRKLLNISHGTLQNLRIRDILHPRKIGGSYYYNLKEVSELFETKKKRGGL